MGLLEDNRSVANHIWVSSTAVQMEDSNSLLKLYEMSTVLNGPLIKNGEMFKIFMKSQIYIIRWTFKSCTSCVIWLWAVGNLVLHYTIEYNFKSYIKSSFIYKLLTISIWIILLVIMAYLSPNNTKLFSFSAALSLTFAFFPFHKHTLSTLQKALYTYISSAFVFSTI